MNRRSYIAALGASIPLAGCSAATKKDALFSVTAPTVQQGEKTMISIEVTDIRGMRFSDFPSKERDSSEPEALDLQLGNVDFTPSPDVVLQSDPPGWQWSSPKDVEAEVPVQTFSDTPIRTYQFTITVRGDDSEKERTESTTVTVEPESNK